MADIYGITGTLYNPYTQNSNVESFKREYLGVWGTNTITTHMGEIVNRKEEKTMQEKLNDFLTKNNIQADKNGNFEAYIVVDADDKENIPGTIFNNVNVETYSAEGAFEDLKETINDYNTYSIINSSIELCYNRNVKKKIKLEKQKSIREKLLTIKDKILKVLVNKENVTSVYTDKFYINKYKVLEEVILNPQIAYKIERFDSDDDAQVMLYNTLTLKSETIILSNQLCDKASLEMSIKKYLDANDRKVQLMNESMGCILE